MSLLFNPSDSFRLALALPHLIIGLLSCVIMLYASAWVSVSLLYSPNMSILMHIVLPVRQL